MRIVNVGQRLVLLDASGAGLDVEKASDGRFSGDPRAIFGQWDAFRSGPRPAVMRAALNLIEGGLTCDYEDITECPNYQSLVAGRMASA